MADKLSARDPRFALWLPGMASFAAIPFAVAVYALDDVKLGLICAAPSLVFSAMYLGPSFAVAANLSSLRMRAMTAAILIFVINLQNSIFLLLKDTIFIKKSMLKYLKQFNMMIYFVINKKTNVNQQ